MFKDDSSSSRCSQSSQSSQSSDSKSDDNLDPRRPSLQRPSRRLGLEPLILTDGVRTRILNIDELAHAHKRSSIHLMAYLQLTLDSPGFDGNTIDGDYSQFIIKTVLDALTHVDMMHRDFKRFGYDVTSMTW